MTLDTLSEVLRADLAGARVVSEAELQAWVERILKAHGVPHVREAVLDVGRPDFLVGRVAVELKVKGSRMDLIRQVQRYTTSPQVDEVLVVTTRLAHTVPATLGGKRVHVIWLTLFGVV